MSELDDLRLQEARNRAGTAAAEKQIAEEKLLAERANRVKAEADRDLSVKTFEEWKENADDRQRTSDLAHEASQITNWSSLQGVIGNAVPNFADIKRGELLTPDDKVMFSTLLKARALEDAAAQIRIVVNRTGEDRHVVVTADPLLLQRDALRLGLRARMEHLASVFGGLPGPVAPPVTPTPPTQAPPTEGGTDDDAGGSEGGIGLAVVDPVTLTIGAVTAAAKLAPQLLSLFAAHRRLTTQELTVDENEAVAAVAGALAESDRGATIVIDSFRFLQDEGDDLQSSPIFTARSNLQEGVIALQVQVASQLALPEAARDAAWLTAAKVLVQQGLDVLSGADAIPPGATMSPLTAAMAVERLRLADAHGVLLIAVAGASAVELTSDRAAAFEDKLHAVGTVALSYSYIDRRTSKVIAGGTATGQSQLVGSIGSTIDVSGIRTAR